MIYHPMNRHSYVYILNVLCSKLLRWEKKKDKKERKLQIRIEFF